MEAQSCVKKALSYLLVLAAITAALKTTAFAAPVTANDCLQQHSRQTDEGLQEDSIYRFENGDTLNPRVQEPLQLLNVKKCRMDLETER